MSASTVHGVSTSRERWLRGPLLLLVGAVLVTGWWCLSHPDALQESGATVGAPAKVGETMLFETGIHVREGRQVVLREVRPVVAEDAVPAAVELAVCRPAGAVGAVAGSFSDHCDSVESVEGARLSRLGQQVVASVRPLEPGTVIIQGFEVSYRDGIRFGSTTIEVRVEAFTDGQGELDD